MSSLREPAAPSRAGARVKRRPLGPRQRHKQACLVLALLLGSVLAWHLRIFLASPSGRFPLLDGAENFALAQKIAQGSLPAEPFFRAMLYPALLGGLLRAGLGADWLPPLAALIGCCLHAGSTVLVYFIARRCWASARAGLVAAALFGLNPVAIYFASEPLDTTLGLFFFLSGLRLMQDVFSAGASLNRKQMAWAISGGTAMWVLAMLTRPHYAIAVAALPFAVALWFRAAPRRLADGLAAFGVVAGVLLGLTGLLQERVGGQFRIMPTQGAYSLWVGNRPGANGRYYEQQIHLTAVQANEGDNPARVESEILFRRETKEDGPLNIDRMNQYWREKTRRVIREQPLAWIGLMTRKVYYLFNNFEQYNNKTFAIQRQLSPVLAFNPLGWGGTLVICAGGLIGAGFLRRRCRGWIFLLLTAAAYGAGVVLFFVSDRFRLPLLPFLCIGAGFWGTTAAAGILRLPVKRLTIVGAGGCAIALLTFSRAWGVYDLTPAVQDYTLLSIAARKAGQDFESLKWARRALHERPDNSDALACAVTAFYNLKLQGTAVEFQDENWETQLARSRQIAEPATGVRLVQAVALWKTGHPEQAREALTRLMRDPKASSAATDDALGVLMLANLEGPAEEAVARGRAGETASFYLLTALRRREMPTRLLVPPARRELVTQMEPFVRNLFP